MCPLARSLATFAFLTIGWRFAGAQTLSFARADYASSAGARAMIAADFNRDGWPDVAHAGLGPAGVSILLNDRDGTLPHAWDVPAGAGPFALAAADFDRDGIVDLVVANADGDSLSVLSGRGDGSFLRHDIPAGRSPRGVIAADLTGDAVPDLAYTAYDANVLVLLRGDGHGGFVPAARMAAAVRPQGLAAADINHDGHLDLVVASDGPQGLAVFYGPAAAFRSASIPGEPNLSAVSVVDLNQDGWDDIAAASTARSRVAIYLGGPLGPVFSAGYPVDPGPRDLAIADLDADGVQDVITASRTTASVTILPGNPRQRGTFGAKLTFASSSGSRAIAAVDFDGDGLIDIATGSQYVGAVSVLSNTTRLLPAALTFGRFVRGAGAVLENRVFQNEGRGLGAADFNHDGRLDVVQRIAGSNDTAVILSDGDTVVLGAAPRQPDEPRNANLVGDFNGDGHTDVVLNDGTGLLTYLGNGRGGFTPVSNPFVVGRCAAGDVNRDARLDVVCVPDVLLGNGDGTFRRGPTVPNSEPAPAALVDIDRDGALDLALGCREFWRGDGAGGFTYGGPVAETLYAEVRPADVNRDGLVDLICSDGATGLFLALGATGGFAPITQIYGQGLESNTDFTVADLDVDGHPDVILNFLGEDADSAGVLRVIPGRGDGTFGPGAAFAMAGGEIFVADVMGDGTASSDGLPDIVAARGREIVVLTNRRAAVNRRPLIEATDTAYAYESGAGETQCFPLAVQARDPDQHALWIAWESAGPAPGPGPRPSGLMGRLTSASGCVDGPGSYRFTVTADDNRGGIASRAVTVTVIGPAEVVLDMTRLRMAAGNWEVLDEATAAAGRRAHDINRGAPKVRVAAAEPANFIELGFAVDPRYSYKLWLRLKADGNSWSNDSVWVQFSGATDLSGTPAYRIGTTAALPVNLEECSGCGISGWGWEDDGWGEPDRNGVLLRFPGGGQQQIRIQTREDGVSVDQIVLSAQRYVTTRPGRARNDSTILNPVQEK